MNSVALGGEGSREKAIDYQLAKGYHTTLFEIEIEFSLNLNIDFGEGVSC
jgi:hypothetical protein